MVYPATDGPAKSPASEEITTICPLDSMSAGRLSRAITNAVVRFARIAASNAVSSVSATDANPCPPAFATNTSRCPCRSSTSCTARRADAVSAASASIAVAPIADATCCSGAARRPTMTTCAPSDAKRSAMAAPIPVPPPVIITTLPAVLEPEYPMSFPYLLGTRQRDPLVFRWQVLGLREGLWPRVSSLYRLDPNNLPRLLLGMVR